MRHESATEMQPRRNLVVVTPCRDEAEFLPTLIDSVLAQTLRPHRWVIVNDGSKDATPEILERAVAEHDFLHVVHRSDRGSRRVGSGVIDAFQEGLSSVSLDDYDYVCKLDADLVLPPGYFEGLVGEMERDPALGTLSGKIYLKLASGALVHERRGDENSAGPSKFYRVETYRDIGGFVSAKGWDGIDGHMCRLRGWIAGSVDRPDLRVEHQRAMGSSHEGVLEGRRRDGAGRWFIGNSLPYMLATSVYRVFDRPFVVGGLSILLGYLEAMMRGDPRFGDESYRLSRRRFERNALLRGKRRALELENGRIRALRAERDAAPLSQAGAQRAGS